MESSKRRKITSAVFALLVTSLFYTSVLAQEQVHELIEANRISIKPMESAGSTFQLSGTPTQLLAVFDMLESTSNAFSEAGNTTINRYNFKDLEVYFEGDKLIALKVKGASVVLYPDNRTAVKTGDHISTLGTMFPKSYALKKDSRMIIPFQLADSIATATVIEFLYNEDGIITAIVI